MAALAVQFSRMLHSWRDFEGQGPRGADRSSVVAFRGAALYCLCIGEHVSVSVSALAFLLYFFL